MYDSSALFALTNFNRYAQSVAAKEGFLTSATDIAEATGALRSILAEFSAQEYLGRAKANRVVQTKAVDQLKKLEEYCKHVDSPC
jgi:hypothetical protein